VRFPFRELPAASGGELTPRPVVDVWLEGVEVTGLACLLDSGALRTRFDAELAQIAGIPLDDAPVERFAVGGQVIEGRPARVRLSLRAEGDSYDWEAPVWFCEPWPFAFQLLGLDGFFRHLRVTIAAYPEWVECQPEST
jgi:hypothetical protein